MHCYNKPYQHEDGKRKKYEHFFFVYGLIKTYSKHNKLKKKNLFTFSNLLIVFVEQIKEIKPFTRPFQQGSFKMTHTSNKVIQACLEKI